MLVAPCHALTLQALAVWGAYCNERRLTDGTGYETKAYNFSLDCESLPWMDRIRKAKGPLPGDGIV